MLTGYICGIATALFSSLSYLFSRSFTSRSGRSPLRLLALSHLLMGVFSILLLPFVQQPFPDNISSVLIPLSGTAVFYLAAQAGLFFLLKKNTASNISPLLGLKILIVGIIGVCIGTPFTPLTAGGTVLAAASVLLLRGNAKNLTFKIIGSVCIVCTLYALSDYSIKYLIPAVAQKPVADIHGILTSVAYTYIMTGIISLGFYKEIFRADLADWKTSLGFAVCWYAAMCCLFAAFDRVGVVTGVVLQSFRGTISVLLGALLARAGLHHLEEKISARMRILQYTAALCMCAAVFLFFKQS